MRNVYVMRFMALVSLLALLGQLALSDSGSRSNHNSNIGTITGKLLAYNDDNGIDRIGIGPTTCSNNDINIVQGLLSTKGIPNFSFTITNVSVKRCSIKNIHLHCGWFSSANLVDPNTFRRLKFNDCLVNNGDVLQPAETVSFQYSNQRPYPLTVSSITCGC